MKENILLLKDSSKFYWAKFISIWLQNVYIDKLDDIENKYNSTYHRIIKMKPVDVKCGNYIEQC